MGMLDNLIDRYVKICSECTDAPTIFHKFTALTCAGVCMSKCWMPYASGRLYPNLWTMLIAPSTSYRKSTCIALGEKLLRVAAPGHIFTPWITPEAFLTRLQEHPHGAFTIREFQKFDRSMEKEYMREMRSLLTDAYDCPPEDAYSRYTLSRKAVELTTRPVISILSATTLDWLNITEESIYGGYLPRFLVVPALEAKEHDWAFPPPISDGVFNVMAERFHGLLDLAGDMRLTKDSKDLYEENYYAFKQKVKADPRYCRPILAPFVDRLMSTVLKLAIIYQGCSVVSGLIVNVEAMEKAWRDVRQIYGWLLQIEEGQFAYTKQERVRKKILSLVRNADKEGVTRDKLLRYGHVSKRELNDILATLLAAHLVIGQGRRLVALQDNGEVAGD